MNIFKIFKTKPKCEHCNGTGKIAVEISCKEAGYNINNKCWHYLVLSHGRHFPHIKEMPCEYCTKERI